MPFCAGAKSVEIRSTTATPMLGMTEIVLCHTDRAEASGAYLKIYR